MVASGAKMRKKFLLINYVSERMEEALQAKDAGEKFIGIEELQQELAIAEEDAGSSVGCRA